MKLISLSVLLFCATVILHSAPLFDVARSKPEHYRLLGRRHAGYEICGDRLRLTIPADPVDRFPGVILLPQKGKYSGDRIDQHCSDGSGRRIPRR